MPIVSVNQLTEWAGRAVSNQSAREQDLVAEQRRQQRQARVALVVMAALVLLVVGGVVWLDRPAEQAADCGAPPAPGVNWQDCRFVELVAPEADLRGVVLTNGALPGARLSGAKLGAGDLRYVDLSGADLSYADLRDARLRGADLRGADLTYALLDGADLSFADLRDARLGGAKWTGVLLSHAVWVDGRRCPDGALGGCDAAASR